MCQASILVMCLASIFVVKRKLVFANITAKLSCIRLEDIDIHISSHVSACSAIARWLRRD